MKSLQILADLGADQLWQLAVSQRVRDFIFIFNLLNMLALLLPLMLIHYILLVHNWDLWSIQIKFMTTFNWEADQCHTVTV